MSGNFSKAFWTNNPNCVRATDDAKGQLLKLQYKEGIAAVGRGLKKHFLSWFHHDFATRTGVTVPVTLPKGDIHLSEAEKQKTFIDGRYWVVVSGGKQDMTSKTWATANYQGVVNALLAQGIRCVQAGADFHRHYQPRLHGCTCVIGKTDNIRDLFSLLYRCEGVICGITSFMHIAAVFDKPCVVIAGGREEPWWEAYTNVYAPTAFGTSCAPVTVEHRFLHTIGLLDCEIGNLVKGCWRDRAVPLDKADFTDPARRRMLCKRPVHTAPQAVPECMQMIEVDHVVEAVMSYYESGELPPIGVPTRKYALPVLPPAPAPQFMAQGIVTSHRTDYRTVPPTEHMSLQLNVPREVTAAEAAEDQAFQVLDHAYIGGRFTVCILGYGNHLDLVQRCLSSILHSVPMHRLDLRVALNQPSPAMQAYVAGLGSAITKTYSDNGDRRKYPAMREMFWDVACPIITPYLLWFDDDSHVIEKDWLIQLTNCIIKNHGQGGRLYGTKYTHDLMPYVRKGLHPERWFQTTTWWKNVWMHMAGGKQVAPNGTEILFVSGGFWAMATETMRLGDIPDTRLSHNGGDITIGEQVNQAGGKIVDFTRGKKPVRWSDAPRRGFHEEFPWCKPQ